MQSKSNTVNWVSNLKRGTQNAIDLSFFRWRSMLKTTRYRFWTSMLRRNTLTIDVSVRCTSHHKKTFFPCSRALPHRSLVFVHISDVVVSNQQQHVLHPFAQPFTSETVYVSYVIIWIPACSVGAVPRLPLLLLLLHAQTHSLHSQPIRALVVVSTFEDDVCACVCVCYAYSS